MEVNVHFSKDRRKKRDGRAEETDDILITRHGYNYPSGDPRTIPHFSPRLTSWTLVAPVPLSHAAQGDQQIRSHFLVRGTASVKRQTNQILRVMKLTSSNLVSRCSPDTGNTHCSQYIRANSKRKRTYEQIVVLQKPSKEVWDRFLASHPTFRATRRAKWPSGCTEKIGVHLIRDGDLAKTLG